MEIMMPMTCISSPGLFTRGCLAGAVWLAAAVLLAPQAGMAQAVSPFVGFAGNWRGEGRVVGTNGNSEPIRCRATYAVSPDGWNLTQALVCASDSYRFDIRSNVVSDGQTVRGSWDETTRNATGNLTGRVNGSLIESTVQGLGFSASLAVRTVGRKQVVSIVPQGADVTKVDITLTR
jgi:hypothetical protein